MRKIYLLFLLATTLVNFSTAQRRKPVADNSNLLLLADKPAADWMTEAYPIGNGRIGAMVFGGVKQEHIQFNEQSLWTGDEKETGAYQAFGDMYIDFEQSGDSTVSAYTRKLDITKAVQNIKYKVGKVDYAREYFCSFPDKVLVLRYTAGQKAAYNAVLKLKDAHGAKITGKGNTLTINGTLDNGLAYAASLKIVLNGGQLALTKDADGNAQLSIKKADSFTVFLTAATNYSNQQAKKWRDEVAPSAKNDKVLAAAVATPYGLLLARHIKDYKNLFGRVKLSLGNGQASNSKTTYQHIVNYKKNNDTSLEALLFQYGRYLFISSSRQGGLPANLQGVWNNSNNPPWRSDYHSNINIQMNYWLAGPTNLAECEWPYIDYINSMRSVKKQRTLEEYPGVRGWTVRTENGVFGGQGYLWNTPGSAWYMQAVWDHYAFTKDVAYLRNTAYPVIKEIVEFWDDHLKRRDDGTMVAPMGWSPEHGPTEDGVTHDQQIIYDLFTNYIEAATILNIDKPYRDRVADMRAHLLKPKIGKWGQLQEWETDRDDPKDNHRHISHLYALHPGRQISPTTTPELAEAARVTLQARGDESTGWSMAWKMNFWARLHDGNHAHKILRNFITLVGGAGVDYNEGGGIYSNLFCAHPPFQIDGNLGYAAGVAEMLLQSQTGELELLPALPDAWSAGKVEGLVARGGFVISELQWQNKRITKLVISSKSGGICKLRLPNGLTDVTGKNTGTTYSFKTNTGGIYTFKAGK